MTNSTASRKTKGKARELNMREDFYIDVARKLFLSEGYQHLTLARVAEETGFSRATVYQRFGCKEELVAQLALRCRREVRRVAELGGLYEGRPRERIIAMGEAIHFCAQLYMDDIRIMSAIDADAIFPRVSPELQEEILEEDKRLFRTLLEPIEEGIATGDLKLPPKMKARALCLTLWTLVDGWAAAMRGAAPVEEVETSDLFAEIVQNIHCLFDGCGWRPLSSERNYDELRAEVFAMLKEGLPDDLANLASTGER